MACAISRLVCPSATMSRIRSSCADSRESLGSLSSTFAFRNRSSTLRTVAGFAHDLEVLLGLDQGGKSPSDDFMVVDEHDPDLVAHEPIPVDRRVAYRTLGNPETTPDSTRQGADMARIVVGVDGSAGAGRALDWAAAETRLRSSDLVLVHAWHVPMSYMMATVAMPVVQWELLEQAAHRVREGVTEQGQSSGRRVEPVLVQGHAAPADRAGQGRRAPRRRQSRPGRLCGAAARIGEPGGGASRSLPAGHRPREAGLRSRPALAFVAQPGRDPFHEALHRRLGKPMQQPRIEVQEGRHRRLVAAPQGELGPAGSDLAQLQVGVEVSKRHAGREGLHPDGAHRRSRTASDGPNGYLDGPGCPWGEPI